MLRRRRCGGERRDVICCRGCYRGERRAGEGHPEELLTAADEMLTSPAPGLGSMWPRACALLIRLALEQTLDRYWARALPPAAECPMRAQLLLLPLYADAGGASGAASLAREAWLGLAGAAHHHAYELAPTAAELRGWHAAVSQLSRMLT